MDIDSGATTWSLIWEEDSCLSANEKSWLAWYGSGTDEIKPINANKEFVVSSVCGLLAVVDRASKQVEVIGWAPGAHSIEALPGGLIAAAISMHPVFPPGAPEIEGNQFQLYDRARPREILWQYEAPSAHGVLWDKSRQVLWALDLNRLYQFRLDQKAPACTLEKCWELPSESGHDLNWYDEDTLLVTTHVGVSLFNLVDETFTPHPQLAHTADVKGISRHPISGETVYCTPDPGDGVYNSADLHFIDQSDKKCTAPHLVYKPRWLVE
jgi:hypothetical protein